MREVKRGRKGGKEEGRMKGKRKEENKGEIKRREKEGSSYEAHNHFLPPCFILSH